MDTFDARRDRMVDSQIKARGIKSPLVLQAMRNVERHLFVPEGYWGEAYEDHPLPIGYGQTISQPYIVALMTDLLDIGEEDTVLEIGTGSGYQAAILAQLADRVITVERIKELVTIARENLDMAGFVNVDVHKGDGTVGYPLEAPYDKIMVTAAGPDIPGSLADQLAENGRLVMPVGGVEFQEMNLVEKINGKLVRHKHGGCRFVKLIGQEGWKEQ